MTLSKSIEEAKARLEQSQDIVCPHCSSYERGLHEGFRCGIIVIENIEAELAKAKKEIICLKKIGCGCEACNDYDKCVEDVLKILGDEKERT